MKKNISKKVYVLIFMCALVISIIMVVVLQIQNRKLEKLNNEIQSQYEEINKKVDEFASKNIQLLKQIKQGEDIIKELQIENKLLKENTGETDLDKEQREAADENSNSNEKEEMVNKARKFFDDRGIKIS